jgi:hypothetical protein
VTEEDFCHVECNAVWIMNYRRFGGDSYCYYRKENCLSRQEHLYVFVYTADATITLPLVCQKAQHHKQVALMFIVTAAMGWTVRGSNADPGGRVV